MGELCRSIRPSEERLQGIKSKNSTKAVILCRRKVAALEAKHWSRVILSLFVTATCATGKMRAKNVQFGTNLVDRSMQFTDVWLPQTDPHFFTPVGLLPRNWSPLTWLHAIWPPHKNAPCNLTQCGSCYNLTPNILSLYNLTPITIWSLQIWLLITIWPPTIWLPLQFDSQ